MIKLPRVINPVGDPEIVREQECHTMYENRAVSVAYEYDPEDDSLFVAVVFADGHVKGWESAVVYPSSETAHMAAEAAFNTHPKVVAEKIDTRERNRELRLRAKQERGNAA